MDQGGPKEISPVDGEESKAVIPSSNSISVLKKKMPKVVTILPEEDEEKHEMEKMTESAMESTDYELVPPDGGWGWLVLAGSMLVNILIPGTIKSFGVLFVEFLETFNASPATAAWIPALCYFLYSSLGPISSILSVKYSFRTVTLLGGTFAAVGMILTFWASSVTYLYISYGILVGTGAGLAFPPTVYIVTSYFVRLRGLANGLCISGSALGSIILPPVLRYLLETFGYRGACLIMGGVTLNVWVAAIFYQPVEQHMKRVPKVRTEPEDTANAEDDEGIVLDLTASPDALDGRGKFAIEDSGTKSPPECQTPTLAHENGFVRSASAVVVRNFSKGSGMDGMVDRNRKISVPVRDGFRNQTYANNLTDLSSNPSLYAVPESRMSGTKLSQRFMNNRVTSGGRLAKRSPSTSSFQYVSTPYHGSTLSIHPAEFASHVSIKSLNPVSSCSRIKKKEHRDEKPKEEGKGKIDKKKFFDLSLLSDPTYLVILISNSTNAIGYTNFIILLPAYAIAMGFDKSLAAYLLSIVSTLDLVGRIGGSALSDTELIPKTWYFVGGLAISGISLAILPLATTYSFISICCACFGLASGVYVGITAVIMADMLGEERLTSTYGISLFVNGILQLVGPPICGLWIEHAKSYESLFTTLGFILFSGAALWGFMPMIKRNKARTERKAAEAEGTETEKSLLA
ncbi:monocarboxylate transporter 13 isoform X1 [Lutzomyia longipalpis]|uniref:monocarboxylate transporter 13 isoform X1 n=2 Tax=Lutzomyia longipalpis TaxID=7200 RepID=UPI0024839C37|nr:monocarboxylate transporter 13 isoform X1 [Lutzomyia longipalpis]